MPKKTKTEDSALISSAKAVGSAAGKLAAMVGVTADPTPMRAKASAKGKLLKKDRHRLPRREKKAQQRSHATQA